MVPTPGGHSLPPTLSAARMCQWLQLSDERHLSSGCALECRCMSVNKQPNRDRKHCPMRLTCKALEGTPVHHSVQPTRAASGIPSASSTARSTQSDAIETPTHRWVRAESSEMESGMVPCSADELKSTCLPGQGRVTIASAQVVTPRRGILCNQ